MIEVQALTKRFGTAVAVEDLTFTVRPGMVTGFLGPNGAGKTTTMRIILGLYRPTAGTTLVEGRPYDRIVRPLHHVGALLDANAVHPARSARNHLRSIARSNGIGARRVAAVLELTGLGAVANRHVGGFSLGMRQRLGIAAALLGDPPVLIFDEPVNGLDTDGILWMRQFMKAAAAEGRTVFVSSHLMSEMALTADHLVVVGRGRLLADSSVAAFIDANTRADVLVRAPRADDLARLLTASGATVSRDTDHALVVTGVEASAIGDLAAEAGIPVHELTPRHASLEQAYLDVTRDSTEFHAAEPSTRELTS